MSFSENKNSGSKHKWSRIFYESGIPHLRYYYRICKNVHISTITVSMTTKLGTVITYHEWPRPIKSHGSFVTWYFGIAWQINNVTSPLSQCLRSTNLPRCWLYTILRLRRILRSHDKLNTLSSHLHQTDDHQILQDKNLPWGTSTQKFT